MIELDHVSFHYRNSPMGIENVSLRIHDGECVVLTGPSGGGKTTITRVINGLAPTYYDGELEGRISINGTSLSSMPIWQIGREIGSVFQDPKSQFFSSELRGEVAFAAENYGFVKEDIRFRTEEAIRTFGLEGVKDTPLDRLSSGEKQRAAIASVYALSPHTYVCDEPTANLDEKGTSELADSLRKLKKEGCTLIIADHRLSWLSDIADRFVYIADGRIIWQRTRREMLELSDEERHIYGLRRIGNSGLVLPSRKPDSSPILLSAEGIALGKRRKVILDNAEIALHAGEITALTGRNGAGKTTLAMILAGLIKADAGRIELSGRKATGRDRRRNIWFSSNDTGTQFFTESVTDELLLGLKRNEATLERAREILNQLGLYGYRTNHPASLSGGQKQRLSIACGILSERKIMILDEPTSGLDGGNMEIIADILKEETTKGRSLLVITHDSEWISKCCSNIISLEKCNSIP